MAKRVSGLELHPDYIALVDGWEKLRKLRKFMGEMETSIKTQAMETIKQQNHMISVLQKS